ncbi:MAG TPA: retropepsin-like aspartic protease [Ignavibacteria bacterium]|nr:retropepsin-like aspartic protease [Ignavibacteria bacterium]HMR39342.1 retropepsin-like aspartic protease [Ignavibacteria bacterium]
MKKILVITLTLLFCKFTFAQEYPVQITDQGYIIVEVTLIDSIKANFILDTGAGAVVLSAKTFEKIKNKAVTSGYFTGFRNDGDRIDGEIYKIPSLAIGDIVQKDVLIGIYPPLDDYGVEGLVSLKFFEDKPFNIDFKNKKITFLSNDDILKLKNNNTAVPITLQIQSDFSLDIFIRICLGNDVNVNAEFDTGSGYNTFLVNPFFMKQLGLDKNKIQSGIFKTPITGTDLTEYKSVLNSVKVCNTNNFSTGNVSVDVPVIFREGLIYEALIGSFLFRNGNITIDIPDKLVMYGE